MPRAPHPAARPAARAAAAATAALLGGALLAAPAVAVPAPPGSPFISEIHYDNPGTDANERVEVQAAPGTDLTGWTLVGVNGNGGTTYSPKTLSGVVGESGVVVVDFPGLQNGSPDGLALLDPSGALVEFLSYEGVFAATLAGATATSTDVGVQEDGATGSAEGSLQRGEDGTWRVSATTSSFGVRNGEEVVTPPPPPAECVTDGLTAITAVQGTGATSPLEGTDVVVQGVVTKDASGLGTVFVQDPDAAPGAASTAVAAFAPSGSTGATALAGLAVGDLVQVSGEVDEYQGQTQVSVDAVAVCGTGVDLPEAFVVDRLTATDAEREQLESMLVRPTGTYTVTEVYNLNRFGEIALAAGEDVLRQATDVVEPGEAAAAYEAENAAKQVLLDDGRSTNLANAGEEPSYGGADDPIRVGDRVSDFGDVSYVLDYRFDFWRLQPTTPVTAGTTGAATFDDASPRTDAPAEVGGDVQVAAFNVLNYFTTFGGEARGATTPEAFERQEAKIVTAINGLGAEVVALQEIENGAALGEDRDEALSTLVDALNEAAGDGTWAFVPSPAALPPVEDQDVIRNAFIYRPAAVTPVGESVVDDDEEWVGRARQPLAQTFSAGAAEFTAVVNHFKSKGSVPQPPREGDEDSGDGQGNGNATRVAEAERLVEFVDGLEGAPEAVVLLGDFNSYTQEDPLDVLREAGYVDLGAEYDAGDTYVFSGRSGSLDHAFASPAMAELVTGADVWDINADESYAYQYDGYLPWYAADQFRASDHDPVVLGVATDGGGGTGTSTIGLLGFNDFHGRIAEAGVALAGTVEEQRARDDVDGTLLVSSGDNIGASPFVSSVQADAPTLEVLDELGLDTSAVGNHEFDRGFADLTGRVGVDGESGLAAFPYLGANVYDAAGEPALPEYSLHEVDGVTVGVIGVVTQETASLVSPSGIEGLTFGDPVEAANRVAAELSDGEGDDADVLVLSAHEGAPDGADSLEELLAVDSAFTRIVTGVDAEVDVILNGHTHQEYAFDAPVPGGEGTRPVVQAGSYGAALASVVLEVDRATGDVVASSGELLALTETPEADLVATYPVVAEVAETVAAAEAYAEEVGGEVIGSVTGDITRAFTADGREDRGSYSAIGGLVADTYVYGTELAPGEPADLGLVNPGGLRADLLRGEDGQITLAEANAVTPFANDLVVVTVTGEQLLRVLEQQWQPAGSSRPFLALGTSEELTWSYDPEAPEGSRVIASSVLVSGEPLDPSASYRVATNSFLASGGDNFTAFAEGTTELTGLIDFDAFEAYLREYSPLSPEDYTDRVTVGEAPAEGPTVAPAKSTVRPGERFAVEVTGFSPREAVDIVIAGQRVGRVRTDADGAGNAVVRVPSFIIEGFPDVVATGAVSGLEVSAPIEVIRR